MSQCCLVEISCKFAQISDILRDGNHDRKVLVWYFHVSWSNWDEINKSIIQIVWWNFKIIGPKCVSRQTFVQISELDKTHELLAVTRHGLLPTTHQYQFTLPIIFHGRQDGTVGTEHDIVPTLLEQNQAGNMSSSLDLGASMVSSSAEEIVNQELS